MQVHSIVEIGGCSDEIVDLSSMMRAAAQLELLGLAPGIYYLTGIDNMFVEGISFENAIQVIFFKVSNVEALTGIAETIGWRIDSVSELERSDDWTDDQTASLAGCPIIGAVLRPAR